MVAVIVVVALLILTTVVVLWRTPDVTPENDVAGTGDDGVRSETTPTTLEGALVAQLLHGEITRGQYQQALDRLAARDDDRNPLSVPGNDHPDAAA